MKTYFYTLVLTLLTSTLLLAQNGTQKNYQDSVNYIEVPIVNPTPEERAQQIQDSIRIANLQANIRDYQKEQIKNNGNASRAVNNDTCGDAIGLTMEDVMCSTPIMGTNVDATASNTDNPAPPMNDQTNDVWYQIIVPNSGIFGMDFTIGTEGDFQLRYAFYTGNCTDLTEVWNRHIGGYNTYNEVFNFAPAGTVLYLRVDPTNKDNNPDAFSICFYQRSCKEANLGWTDVLSCDNTNDFYVNFQIYNFGSGDQLTFKSDGVADVTVMAADNNYGDLYPVGPFPMGQEVTIDIEPDDAICNQSYSFFRSANTTISNAVPCSAIDISSAIGSTYDYTEGTDYNIEYVCTPMVPRGGCNAIGYWQDNNNFDGSEWFSFVASASENLKFTFSSNESHYSFKVAIWDAVSCTDIQNGTPELVTAYHPCNSSEPFSITASCLDIGKTYYLQVADSYVNYSIAVEEVSLPCTILNDKSEDAISLTVQTDPCGTTETAFNVGATDSRNDTNVPNFIDNFTEYDNDSNPIGDGTDIWFKTIVPASGNLSIKVTSVNDDNFKAVANLYTGTVNLLEHLNTGAIYWQGEVGIIYFSGLPVGEEIHIAIDYRNNGNQTGYFDLCVMDPSCLPMDWHTGRIVINCENTNEYFVDVVIVDVATATTFNIVNVNDNTIYYEDLSAIGTYTIGPIPISNASIEVKVVSDNPSCDREGNYMYTEANTISNYLPCSAIDLSSAIGGSYDYAEGSISNTNCNTTNNIPPRITQIVNCVIPAIVVPSILPSIN